MKYKHNEIRVTSEENKHRLEVYRVYEDSSHNQLIHKCWASNSGKPRTLRLLQRRYKVTVENTKEGQ